MGESVDDLRSLYRGREGRVTFVDVPALHYLVLTGAGDPDDAPFSEALEALTAASSAVRQVIKRRDGTVPAALPLESLWWVEPAARVELVAALALDLTEIDRRAWRWQVMIAQPGVDEPTFDEAIQLARKKARAGLDEVRLVRWHEGRAAQVLHVGPCAEHGAVLAALHQAIEEAGYRPHGRQHEIHISDFRRTAPTDLRTLVRQPVAPG